MTDELPTPHRRETDLLKALWDLGPSSVRDVHAAVNKVSAEPIAYNTVQTMLRLMEGKQLVTHHAEGRTSFTPRGSAGRRVPPGSSTGCSTGRRPS